MHTGEPNIFAIIVQRKTNQFNFTLRKYLKTWPKKLELLLKILF